MTTTLLDRPVARPAAGGPAAPAHAVARQTLVVAIDAPPRDVAALLPRVDAGAPVAPGAVDVRRTFAARPAGDGTTWLAVTTHVVASDSAAAAPVLDAWRVVEPTLAALARRAAHTIAAAAEAEAG